MESSVRDRALGAFYGLALGDALGMPTQSMSRSDILADYGNQVSASLPTALDHAVRTGRLGPGRTALLLGTGAGVARAALVMRT